MGGGARRRWRRFRASDGGQLLLLAGVILVLSFITTALTLNQVANLEARVSEAQQSPLLEEFRFLRTEFNRTLDDTVAPSTTNASFNDTFERLVSSLELVENSRGYDAVIVKARPGAPGTSEEFQNYTRDDAGSRVYDGWSFDGRRNFAGHPFDGGDDGLIVYIEEGDDSAHIKGVAIYIYLADQTGYVEESVLVALNV